MLSRVADSLYWMSRYIERAENTARLLDVNLHLMLDFEGLEVQETPDHWLPIVCSTGGKDLFETLYRRADSHSVLEFLTFNPENPNSVLSCISHARENARMVRDQISGEMWEVINSLFHKLRSKDASGIWRDGPFEFFEHLKQDSLLFQGLTESTYVHEQGYKFMQAGKMLERADQTSRILDIKYHMLLPSPRDLGGSVDMAQWMAILRSCSAFEAYHHVYVDDVQPWNVAEFLILSPTFPRSIRFCVGTLDYHLRSITHTARGSFTNLAEKLCGRLLSEVSYTTIDDVYREGLHEYLDRLQFQLIELHKGILESYVFHPEVDLPPATPAADGAAQEMISG